MSINSLWAKQVNQSLRIRYQKGIWPSPDSSSLKLQQAEVATWSRKKTATDRIASSTHGSCLLLLFPRQSWPEMLVNILDGVAASLVEPTIPHKMCCGLLAIHQNKHSINERSMADKETEHSEVSKKLRAVSRFCTGIYIQQMFSIKTAFESHSLLCQISLLI